MHKRLTSDTNQKSIFSIRSWLGKKSHWKFDFAMVDAYVNYKAQTIHGLIL